jgi:molecular chaperone GrpE
VIAKFLDVLDDLNRVAQLDLSNATVEAIMEGVDLVERKFIRVLEDSGVEVIDPVDAAFDPEIMEAMMRVPVDAEEQDDVVAQVFGKGYSLKGVLVRPARVSVYKLG